MQAVGVKVTGIPRPHGRAWLAAALPWWMGMAAILAVALFLRLYRLGDQFVTFYPDTYERMAMTSRILSGHLPTFEMYPPGVSLFLAPVFAVAPRTVATLQGVIVAAGVALVIVSYFAARATTKDQRAALLFAAAVGVATPFVIHSRIALFDVVNTLLIVLSVFLVPVVVRRGGWALLAYAVLVFITATVRLTNVLLLPALFLYSLHLDSPHLSWRRVSEHLRSRAVLTVGLALLALYAGYAALGYDFLAHSARYSGNLITLDRYLLHLGQYLGMSLTGFAPPLFAEGALAALVLGLAAVGARRLWEVNRGLLVAIAYIVILWPLAHALFTVFQARYMLPPFYFVLLLAIFGLSVSLRRLPALPQPWQRAGLAYFLTLAAGLFLIVHLGRDGALLYTWPSHSLETVYGEMRPVIGGLESGSVLVTTQVLGVEEANPSMEYVDLIRYSRRYGINPEATRRLVDDVDRYLGEGRSVYYLSTPYEALRLHSESYGDGVGYAEYFDALGQTFSLTEVARPSGPTLFRLYRVEPSAGVQ